VILAGLVGVFVYGSIYGISTGRFAGVKLGVIAIILLVGIGTALKKVLSVKAEPYGARADRADQPELWRMIDELAVAANTRGPDEVWIVPEVNAAVWEKSHLLGLKSGRRYMMIGLPLLAGLSVSELRSVLGHELGHYSHSHTKLSAITYRATTTMKHTLAEIDGWLRWLLMWYVRLYLLVARSANRAQELQADVAAVRAAGKTAARTALGKVNALDMAWDHYTDSYVSLVRPAGRTPELLMGFHEFLADDLRRRQMLEVQEALLDTEPASRYDSHPPMRVRISAVDALPDPDQPLDSRPGWTVLRDPAVTVPQLESELVADGLGPRAPWAEIVRVGTANVVKQNAKTLREAATKSGFTQKGSLDEVLDVLQRGEGPEMVARMGSELDQDERFTVFHRLLSDSVANALIEAGHAQFELNWADTWQLRLTTGDLADVNAVVTAAMLDPAQVQPLRDWLANQTAATRA
jgi:Zn-dependent protease with chaperone function